MALRGRSAWNWLLWVGLVLAACSIPERLVEERASGGAGAVSPVGSAHGGAPPGAPTGGSPVGKGGVGGFAGAPGGFAAAPGGFAAAPGGFAAAPGGFAGAPGGCMVPTVTPTCAAAGMPSAPAPAWCDNASGAGGEPSAAGLVVVDDFEDRDDVTSAVLNGRGGWFVANDGTGQQYPGPCVLPTTVPQHRPGSSSSYAMHTFGLGFQTRPEGFASVGVALRSGPPDCASPVDATGYDGVQFWVRGTGYVRFVVATVATTPLANFGSCQSGCYDSHGSLVELTPDWSLVQLPFAKLSQEGWGTPAAFDPAQILTLQWSPKDRDLAPGGTIPASCFDFWIDDVAFYKP